MEAVRAPDGEWQSAFELQSPFAEAFSAEPPQQAPIGFAAFTHSFAPFAEAAGEQAESDGERLADEALSELRDEGFDEAVAFLAEETEQAIADRFTSETPANAIDRQRFGQAQLSAVGYEAHRYLGSLQEGLGGTDVGGLNEEQLDEVLQRFDPGAGELTPAGEEFIGKLVKKAKSVVKFAANAAKSVGKVAGGLLSPILRRLKALINPLLKRVLSFAIGRLPAPLRPAARKLASRIQFEGETDGEAGVSPANLADLEGLAYSFDASLAEAFAGGTDEALEFESEEGEEEHEGADGLRLETLTEARSALLDRIESAAEGEDLAPAIEQFVPALLGALRLGINLVGRPKVVGFLAKYLAQLIGRWVGPQLSRPLSNAIVDTGLRLISLEAVGDEAEGGPDGEAGPAALAGVIEDTVRRLSENEEFVFEDEGLMELAAAEAFAGAVGTHFPQSLVKASLQQAPALGGTFVGRRLRTSRPFAKYTRVPEVTITSQIADAIPAFGGSTLGAVLRAAGLRLPLRARLHIFHALAGTSLASILRRRRARSLLGAAALQPLTRGAAGLLLREPQLGVDLPPAFLRSSQRIAAGQRFYLIEPAGAAAAGAPAASAGGRAIAARVLPSRFWMRLVRARRMVTMGFYLSEADTQQIAQAIRLGSGPATLLQRLNALWGRGAASSMGSNLLNREIELEEEGLAPRLPRPVLGILRTELRKRARGWVMPVLSTWVRNNAEAFARAAQHPDPGVTIRVRLTSVPGLALLSSAGSAMKSPAALADAFRGTPAVAITLAPGRGR